MWHIYKTLGLGTMRNYKCAGMEELICSGMYFDVSMQLFLFSTRCLQ